MPPTYSQACTEMSPTLSKLLYTTWFLLIVFLAFVFAPVPGLEASYGSSNRIPSVEEGMAFFDQILEGESLARPFPAMPVRPDNPATTDKIELGRLLFFDPLLSGDNSVSCATCHHPDLGFSDNRMLAMGMGGRGIGPGRQGGSVLTRNTPSIWNAAFNQVQYWDGRAADLEEQAGSPILDPHEMGQDPERLVEELRAIPDYVSQFEASFGVKGPGAVTFDNVTYAIAAFERTLVSQNARYDQYAAGEQNALSPAERRGLNLFRSLKTRCFECHNLPTFANPDFKVIGVPDLPNADADLGRGEIEGDFYKGAFKVPTLRNVALTAPYMHNGIFKTLSEVIDFYAAGGGPGMGRDTPNLDEKIRPFVLTPREKDDLIAFLHALTDESARPAIPDSVPSGMAVVQSLNNQSSERPAYGGKFRRLVIEGWRLYNPSITNLLNLPP